MPAGPLILAVATELDRPAIDLPSTPVTNPPFLMPAFFGRRAVEHVDHAQAAAVLVDAHPDALEAAADRLLEPLRSFGVM